MGSQNYTTPNDYEVFRNSPDTVLFSVFFVVVLVKVHYIIPALFLQAVQCRLIPLTVYTPLCTPCYQQRGWLWDSWAVRGGCREWKDTPLLRRPSVYSSVQTACGVTNHGEHHASLYQF
jgi:hypothetical protein